jgi:hypothetical protein
MHAGVNATGGVLRFCMGCGTTFSRKEARDGAKR